MATYNMDTYIGPAAVHSLDGFLGAVHADIKWQGETWSGVLVATPEAMNWINKDLTLHIDGHPAAEIGIKDMSDSTTGSGQVRVYIQGLRRAPFWAACPQEELIQELWNRRPVAGTSVWHDESNKQIRDVLKDRDGMTDAAIAKAIEALNDA